MLNIFTGCWHDDTQHSPRKLTGDAPLAKVANTRNCRTLTQTSDVEDWVRRQFMKFKRRCAKFHNKDRTNACTGTGNNSCMEKHLIVMGDSTLNKRQCKL